MLNDVLAHSVYACTHIQAEERNEFLSLLGMDI